MPSASSTSTSASVPFAQLTASSVPSWAAASRSNASTSGPKMKRPLSRVCANASFSSGTRGAYCALTSTWGIGIGLADRSRRAPSHEEDDHGQDDQGEDEVVEIAEVVAGRVPARPDRPPDPGHDRAEDGAAERSERDEAPEGPFEDAGGKG